MPSVYERTLATIAPFGLFAFTALIAPDKARAQASGAQAHDPLPAWAELFEEFLAWDLLSVPVWRLSAFVLILVLGLFLKNVLIRRLLTPVDRLLSRTDTDIDNQLVALTHRPMSWLAFVIAAYFAVLVLDLPAGLQGTAVLVLQSAGTGVVAWALFKVVDVAVLGLGRLTAKTDSEMDDHIVPLIGRVLRIVLVALTAVAVIQQWGYDVTSLLAGLGIGGLALALAAQDTLSNWFGSLMIFTDRPFKPGDWVKGGYGEGVVEEVGLRSTKIRTFAKTLITVPNKEIANEATENFSEMNKRRIKTTLGLTYATTEAQMEQVLEGVRDLLRTHPAIDQEFWLVHFVGFGPSSLDLLVYAFTTTTDWGEWLQARQEIYLGIMRVVEEAGAGFAFPSQSIYFENPLPLDSPQPRSHAGVSRPQVGTAGAAGTATR